MIILKFTAPLLFAFVSLSANTAFPEAFKLRAGDGRIYYTDVRQGGGGQSTILKKYRFRNTSRLGSPRDYRRLSFSNRYDSLIRSAASRYGLDPIVVKSVIKVESGFNHMSVSSKGAKGLMQLMPKTASAMNVHNVFDPKQNIFGGTKYLKRMISRFGGDLRLGLAAYNAGPRAVSKYGGIPPYRETIRYVDKVMQARRALYVRGSVIAAVSAPAAPARKNHYYLYKNGIGIKVYTDMPVGKKRIFRY